MVINLLYDLKDFNDFSTVLKSSGVDLFMDIPDRNVLGVASCEVKLGDARKFYATEAFICPGNGIYA